MMTTIDIFFLAIALAMDCFTVSIVSGVIMRRMVWRMVLRMAFLFGLFQALMPLLGWWGISYFSEYIIAFDHWIAFTLLAFIGGKMVKESFEEGEEAHFHPERLRTQLLLAVSTSIDAPSLPFPLTVIGLVSLVMSVAGNWLGVRFGRVITHRFKPELVGGVILILIGVKILLEHLFG